MKKNNKIDYRAHNNCLRNGFILFIIFLAIMSVYFFFTGRPHVVSFIFYFVALLYFSIFPLSFILHRKKNKFKCVFCGECCRLKFKLKKSDIVRFERGRIDWKKFTDEKWDLKKINGNCVFLKKKNGKKICSVYKFRPSTCRKWPFFSNPFFIPIGWFFTCPSLRKLIFQSLFKMNGKVKK